MMSEFVYDFLVTWVAATLVFAVLTYAFSMMKAAPREAIAGSVIIGLIYTICDAFGMMPL
jgi:hypothetical protein